MLYKRLGEEEEEERNIWTLWQMFYPRIIQGQRLGVIIYTPPPKLKPYILHQTPPGIKANTCKVQGCERLGRSKGGEQESQVLYTIVFGCMP